VVEEEMGGQGKGKREEREGGRAERDMRV